MEPTKKRQKPSKEGLILLLLGAVALAGLLYMAYGGGSSGWDRPDPGEAAAAEEAASDRD
jgi:hypothetical protein